MKINPKISQWFTRTAAGSFFAFFGITGALPGLTYQNNLSHFIFSVQSIVFALIGVLYAYKYFDYPSVNYYEPETIGYQKLIAMLWFGALSFIFIPIEPLASYGLAACVAIPLLPAIAGWHLGYRVLLLPLSFRGLIKALMIGFMVFLFSALFYVFLLVLSNEPVDHMHDDQAILNSVVNFYLIFAMGIIRYCPQILLGTVLLYFLGLPFNRALKHSK